MAENITTTTQVDPGVATWYDKVLLRRAKPYLVHGMFSQKRNLKRKSGNTIKFRRYAALSTATTPLSEGVTPSGQRLSKTDLSATVAQYGDFVHVSDWVDLTVEDAVLTETAGLLGDQMGETRDELCRDVLIATASTQDVSGVLDRSDIRTAVKTLLGNNAKMISNLIPAGQGQGTTPVRPAYWGIMHTDLVDDLEDITGFKSTAEYPRQEPVMQAEWGATDNVRWLLSTKADKTSGGTDTYDLLVIAQDAYGETEIEGSAQNIVKAFGDGGTSDPLNQRATSGWKMTYVCRILNDSFMLSLTNVQHS